MKNKGQFKKGSTPWNLGVKVGSRSEATEFKEGRIPHNFKGIGTPCVSSRQEVYATTTETKSAKSRGKPYITKRRTTYARYLWIEAHGPIPRGHVIYNHGHPTDIKLENLEMISRAELVKRNKNHE